MSYFPLIYKDDTSVSHILTTVMKNHHYFSLLSNSRTNLGYTNRWIQGAQLCTIIASKMFLLAMLFDICYPIDDGTCPINKSELSCLQRKSALGTFCTWTEDTCQFTTTQMSIMSVVIIGWLTLLLLVPIKTCISFVFDSIICAASHKFVEKQIRETSVVKQIRRMSVNLSRRISKIIQNARLSEMLENSKKITNVTSTMIVNSDFIQMRKSVVEVLQTNDDFLLKNESNTATEDKSIAVQMICRDFTEKFVDYRDSLSDLDRLKFDKNWEFLQPESIVASTTDENDNEKLSAFSDVIFSEVSAVYQDSCRALGIVSFTTQIFLIFIQTNTYIISNI